MSDKRKNILEFHCRIGFSAAVYNIFMKFFPIDGVSSRLFAMHVLCAPFIFKKIFVTHSQLF